MVVHSLFAIKERLVFVHPLYPLPFVNPSYPLFLATNPDLHYTNSGVSNNLNYANIYTQREAANQ